MICSDGDLSTGLKGLPTCDANDDSAPIGVGRLDQSSDGLPQAMWRGRDGFGHENNAPRTLVQERGVGLGPLLPNPPSKVASAVLEGRRLCLGSTQYQETLSGL